MATNKKELTTTDKVEDRTRRIQHSLFIDNRILLALLNRCGHAIDNKAEIKWVNDGARVQWTTSVI